MSSMQQSAPGSKSMKFQNGLNPFTPFLSRPGEELEGAEKALAENLDRRLQVNHDLSSHTNNNNRYAQPQPPRQVQVQQQQMAAVPPTNLNSTLQEETTNNDEDEDDEEEEKNPQDDDDDSDFDNDFEDDLDDDAALEAFRRRRLAELKQSATKEDEQRAKGHGEVRTIVQDEFLPECCSTSSHWVVVHFFHKDFERCKIMDHHLNRIAPLHLSCKFVRIDAEKTPFFVTKLNIRTLPTLLVFKDGKTVDRLVGFDGLLSTNSSSFKNPDEFTTSSLGRFLERTGCIEYEGPDSDDDDDEGGRESHNAAARATVRKGLMQSRLNAYDEDF